MKNFIITILTAILGIITGFVAGATGLGALLVYDKNLYNALSKAMKQ